MADNYTIPSDNRELQHADGTPKIWWDYTIPSDNRELQHTEDPEDVEEIIPYQVITGNYNGRVSTPSQ